MRTRDHRPWLALSGRPLAERLGSAPEELLHHLAAALDGDGAPARPSAGIPGPGFLADVREAIRGMPSIVQEVAAGAVLGVYLVRGLRSSAVTDVVLCNETLVGSVVVLNLDVLERTTANEWASRREREPFAGLGPAGGLAVELQDPDGDSRRNALQYLLLHEFGHAITAPGRFLPDWWMHPDALEPGASFPFLSISWEIDPSRNFLLKTPGRMPLRDSLVFYGRARLGIESVPTAYEQLAATDLPTLYAAQNPYDDFAECFAMYVHTVLMGLPYRVVRTPPEAMVVADAEGVAKRCRRKFAMVARLLAAAA